MDRNKLLDLLASGPVIAAVKSEDGLAAALESDVSVIFLLSGDILTVADAAARVRKAGKRAFVHLDLVDGLAAREVSYADFVTIQRDESGAITALTTDMAKMNLRRSELTAAILEALEEADVSAIQVPLGSLFDLEPLWAKGPALKTRAITVGTVRAEFESQLTSAGVNQTLHRIWMEVEAPITLLLPGGEVETSLHTQLCVAETVIVGRVPDTYLQLDGVKS